MLKTASGEIDTHSRTKAFERHYLESYGRVHSYVCLRTGSRSASEQVVSDAYMRAAQKYSQFDPTSLTFSAWVIGFAAELLDGPHGRSDPSSQTPADGTRPELPIGMLAPQEADLLLMRCHDAKSDEAIADELGVSPSKVRAMLADALRKVQEASRRA